MDQDKQTEAVFKSVRAETDPVSGNEVPTGALPEEVRDDVPAMLSEGEYIVPADVLRYYGLKYFEDLRNKAKAKMEELDADGRIGGEPVDEAAPVEEDLPFDPRELQVTEVPEEEMGMYSGGYVKGYNEGGDVTKMETPDFLTTVTPPSAGDAEEYRTFTNAEGMTMTVRFVNGKPVSYIPPGYTEVGATDGTPAEPTQPRTPASSGGNDDNDRDIYFEKKEGEAREEREGRTRVADMTDAQLSEALSNYGEGRLGKIGRGVVGALNPLAGVGTTLVHNMQGNYMLDEARRRLQDDTITPESTSVLTSGIDTYESNNDGKASDFFQGVTGYDSVTDMLDGGGKGKRDPSSNLMAKVTGGYTSLADMFDGGGPGQSASGGSSVPASTPSGGGSGNDNSSSTPTGGNAGGGSFFDRAAQSFGFDNVKDAFDGGGRGASRSDKDEDDDDK